MAEGPTASVGTVTVGDTWRLPLAWDEPDPDNPGERRVKDIAGYTVVFEARERAGGSVVLAKSSANGADEVEYTDAASGESVVKGATTDLSDVEATTDLHCLVRLSGVGEQSTTSFRLRAKVVG